MDLEQFQQEILFYCSGGALYPTILTYSVRILTNQVYILP